MANTLILDRARNWRLDEGANIDPFDIASADFNNDGFADVVVSFDDDANSRTYVLLNDGVGGFDAPIAVDAIANASNLVIADVDRDGNADILTAGGQTAFVTGPNEVLIQFGDGQGGFTDGGRVQVGNNPTDMAFADLNGDGNGDLITAHESDETVGVRLGNSGDGFDALAVTNVPRGALRVIATDVDGDRNRDVVVLSTSTLDDEAQLVPLLGDGQGGLTRADALATGLLREDATDFDVGDFNGDGAPDFAIAHAETGVNPDHVTIVMNDGGGNIARATELDMGNSLNDTLVTDLNRDGRDDVIGIARNAGEAHIRLGNGDGTFTEAETARINGDNETTSRAVATDLDGDGFPDLALTNEALDGVVSVVANKSDEGLPRVTPGLDWTAAVGGPERDTVHDLAVDDAGNVIVSGYQDQRGGGEADKQFIAKYDADGARLWFNTLNNDENDRTEVAVDSDGNIFMTSTAQGGFGSLDQHLSAQIDTANSGTQDIYLRKYSPDGETLWTEQIGSGDLDSQAHLAVRGDGDVILAASAAGRFAADHESPAKDDDVAVVRFTNDGDVVWSRLIGSMGDDSPFGGGESPHSVRIDPENGEIVVGGRTQGSFASADIDGGATGISDAEGSPDHAGTGEAFVLRLDPETGDLIRSRQFETNNRDGLTELAVGPDGSTTTVGTLDFIGDALPDQPPIPNSDSGATFAVTYDGDGNRTWTRTDTPLTGDAGAAGIAIDGGGKRYIAGNDTPAVLVTDAEGNLLTEISEEIFSEANTGFGSGDTTAVVHKDGALYLAGSSNQAWAGAALGEDTDGWLAKLDISTAFPESPDFELLSLSIAEQVAALYVGYFGRAPGKGGLDFWEGDYENRPVDPNAPDQILRGQAESFRVSEEAIDLYPILDPDRQGEPSRSDVEDFVTDVYENLFSRQPTEGGLTFWADNIEGRLQASDPIGDAIVDIVSGAQNRAVDTDGDGETDAQFNDSATMLNKIAVALAHGRAVGDGDDLNAVEKSQAADVLSTVGTSGQSIAEGLAEVEDLAPGRTPLAVNSDMDVFIA